MEKNEQSDKFQNILPIEKKWSWKNMEDWLNNVYAYIADQVKNIKQEMGRDKTALEKKLQIQMDELRREYNLRLEQLELQYDSRLRELEKNYGFLLSHKVKNDPDATKFRETHGGAISSIQHQDLLLQFKDLFQHATALSREVNGNFSLFERCRIRSQIASIFIEEKNYEAWLSDILLLAEIQQYPITPEDEEVVGKKFAEFYNKAISLKDNFKKVNPIAEFNLPLIGELFDEHIHTLVNDKCDETKRITLVVFPGVVRGNRIDEKAIVYTDIKPLDNQ